MPVFSRFKAIYRDIAIIYKSFDMVKNIIWQQKYISTQRKIPPCIVIRCVSNNIVKVNHPDIAHKKRYNGFVSKRLCLYIDINPLHTFSIVLLLCASVCISSNNFK